MSIKYCKLAIVLIALALATLIGVSKVAYAQSNITIEDERGIFDPFTLNTILISVTDSSPNTVVSRVTRPPMRIPVRPCLRSYFRPPLVQIQ
jgi:hypothetical protein